MSSIVIGVLALQGAFAKHVEMFHRLGIKVIEVRKPAELAECNALVIPGGESTTMMKQMQFIHFLDPLLEFSKKKPIFGTCAGLILMSQRVIGDSMKPLHLLNIDIERNAFGRQAESFQTEIEVHLKSSNSKEIPAVFIRAPRIRRIGDEVKVLASLNGEPILIQQGFHLGSTFHPELTKDSSVHTYFLSLVHCKQNP